MFWSIDSKRADDLSLLHSQLPSSSFPYSPPSFDSFTCHPTTPFSPTFHLDNHTLIFCYYSYICFVWSKWGACNMDRWFSSWYGGLVCSRPTPFTCFYYLRCHYTIDRKQLYHLYSIRPQLFYNLVFLVLSCLHTHTSMPILFFTSTSITHTHTHPHRSPCLVVALLFYSLYMMRFPSNRNIAMVVRIVKSLCSFYFWCYDDPFSIEYAIYGIIYSSSLFMVLMDYSNN